MASSAAVERAALLELLAELGPTAGTLCEGWSTHDLAAHLVARERRPQALPGLLVPVLQPLTAATERRQRARPYDDLLADLRTGPPVWSPARWSEVGELHEWYVHHEDVRRLVDLAPPAVTPELDAGLWSRLMVFGPLNTARAHGLGITIATPAGRTRRVRRGSAEVTVRGTAAELTMWLFGRRSVADVVLEGRPAAVLAAREAPVGL